MFKTNYKIDEINIGDDVLINDKHQSHHNLFWRVINKISKNRLIVEIKDMGYAEKYTISIKDVINLEKDCLTFHKFNF